MKTGLLALLIGCAAVSPAHAAFFSYFEWEQLSENSQAAYLAGAFDSYMAFEPSYSATANHLDDCVADVGLTTTQLARNFQAFAATQPDKQRLAVPAILIQYLVTLCGPIPSN